MKRGPIKATIAPAAPLLTDWIPCTTPPVRDGEYEVESLDHGDKPWRATYRKGQWFAAEGGFATRIGDRLPQLISDPEKYQWRGVRRWVLVRRQNNPLMPYLIFARPKASLFGVLASARPFKTEAAAQRFADRHQRLNLTAVLP